MCDRFLAFLKEPRRSFRECWRLSSLHRTAVVGSSRDNGRDGMISGVGVSTFWWLLAYAANLGLYYAVRLRLAKVRRRSRASPRGSAEIERRAEQQAR